MIITSKKVFVSGGTRGIGAAIAVRLHELGNSVVVCGSTQLSVDAFSDVHPDIDALVCDVTRADDIERCKALLRSKGGLDILVNNAGVCRECDPLQADNALDSFSREIAVNLVAPLAVIKNFLPLLEQSREATIVNISSIFGFALATQAAGYSATKSALHFMTRSMRHELRPKGIRVIEIIPPPVDTDMSRKYSMPKISKQAVVNSTVRALQGNRDEVFIGQAMVLYWLNRISRRHTEALMRHLGKQIIKESESVHA